MVGSRDPDWHAGSATPRTARTLSGSEAGAPHASRRLGGGGQPRVPQGGVEPPPLPPVWTRWMLAEAT